MSAITNPQQMGGPPALEYTSPLGGVVQTGGQGFNLRDVMRVLQQRKLLIIITAVIVFAISVGVTFAVKRWYPGWPSSALFELQPPKEGVWATADRAVQPQIMEQMLRTEAQKLKELGLLLEIVAQPEIKRTRYYAWYDNDAMKAAIGLQKDLSVGPVPDSRLIQVSLVTRDRAESRQLVRALVDKYVNKFTQAEQADARKTVESIQGSLDRLRTVLAGKRKEAEAFRQRTDAPALEGQWRNANNHLTMLRTEVNAIETQVAALQAQLDSIAGHDPESLPLTTEQQLQVESDPQLRYYVSQVEALDVEIEVMLERLGEQHWDVKLARKRRAEYHGKEIAKREELVGKIRRMQIESLRQHMAQAQNVLNRRQEQLDDAQAQERDLNRNIQQHQEMQNEIKMLEEQIAELEQRRLEAQHYQSRTDEPRLRVVSWPVEAVTPSRPQPLVWLGAGFVLACACGVGLAFLRELTDQVVRTPLDVVRHGQISVLGTIPLLDDEEADVEDIEQAVIRAPQSLVAEAFRRTRTHMQFSGPMQTQRSLLITSPSPGDGKTAVAMNLAATLAHSGQRVLLIDCNFRRPDLRERYNLSRTTGLSNILIGESTLSHQVEKTELPNLDVLLSGPMPPTPAELLGSEPMRKLLDEALSRYDRVLLDGPPALLISDASVLSGMVDGVILVARADANSKGVLKRTCDGLEKINARVIGGILNGVRARPGGYFREQYREFYEYASDETIPPELPEPTDGNPRA